MDPDRFRRAALAWAARGLRVFPLRPGTKLPYQHSDWTVTASDDPGIIAATWSDPVTGAPLAHNIGVLCDGLVVIDVDVKNVGRDVAMSELVELGVELNTLTVTTPSGGQHIYFRGPAVQQSVRKLGTSLDVRSHNGYVVAPGSWLDPAFPGNKKIGGDYLVALDAPIAAAPDDLIRRCGQPRERASGAAPLADLDRPEAFAIATYYLDREAPAAVEGQGGDGTTFRVAAKLKDFGVSEASAKSLMWERWNDRCSPPWDLDELARKVENAYRYGSNAPGVLSPQVQFDGVDVSDGPPLPAFVAGRWFRPYTPADALPLKPWIMHGLLCRRVVTVIAAEGGSGKTGLTVALAAHVAMGKDFAGWRSVENTRVLVINAEDDRDELQARMHAVCATFGWAPGEMAPKVTLEADPTFRIAAGRHPTVAEHLIAETAKRCVEERVGLIVVDPLRLTHDCDENDNGAMASVMRAYASLARRADAALILVHHANRSRGKQAGDVGASRGASAVTDHARIALTMVNAQGTDVEKFGVPADDMEAYARVDDAKQNLARKRPEPRWFRKVTVPLPNGDETFVMRPASLVKDRASDTAALARCVFEEMAKIGSASTTAYHVGQLVRDADPLLTMKVIGDAKHRDPKTTAQALGAKFREWLRNPAKVVDGDRIATVQYIPEKDGDGLRHLVVIR